MRMHTAGIVSCLHCGALPLPADGVANLDVDLWAIKGTATHILGEIPPLQNNCTIYVKSLSIKVHTAAVSEQSWSW